MTLNSGHPYPLSRSAVILAGSGWMPTSIDAIAFSSAEMPLGAGVLGVGHVLGGQPVCIAAPDPLGPRVFRALGAVAHDDPEADVVLVDALGPLHGNGGHAASSPRIWATVAIHSSGALRLPLA